MVIANREHKFQIKKTTKKYIYIKINHNKKFKNIQLTFVYLIS